MSDYKQTVSLNHNEIAAKVNIDTGCITEVAVPKNNVPSNKEMFNPGYFSKKYIAAWDYLLDKLSDKEIAIVTRMTLMTRPNSNSLEPLNNNSSIAEISSKFNIHRNSVKTMFNKLLKNGVYAEFKFGSKTGIKQYWVLNPYIDFKGKTISKALVDLFRETTIAELVEDNKQFYIS